MHRTTMILNILFICIIFNETEFAFKSGVPPILLLKISIYIGLDIGSPKFPVCTNNKKRTLSKLEVCYTFHYFSSLLAVDQIQL